MLTYQNFLEIKDDAKRRTDFVLNVINEHRSNRMYKTAVAADEYDAERNVTILEFVRTLFSANGQKLTDETASNMKLTSNYFARLNTQRCTYSLGNGLTFQESSVGKKLGPDPDKKLKDAGYYGMIHGVSFLYWAYDHIHTFKLTEFAPLWDEQTSDLGAGVRFWQISPDKPIHAVLYSPDGYIEYESETGGSTNLAPKTGNFIPYRMTVQTTPAVGGDVETAHNYASLPIIPLWGSRLHQSTLVGMRSKIDAYDSVLSGFANDMTDCAQIYWIVNNAGGMTENDLAKFRERLLYRHIANVNGDDGVSITPYTQEIPYNARKALLEQLHGQIYSDFGALDTKSISAAAKTATEINAAYQPLDENADDFEYQVIDAVQKLLALQGVDAEKATPQFKRNRVANQLEQTQMVMTAANYLDDEAVLNHLPWLTPEEVDELLKRKAAEELDRSIVEQDALEDGVNDGDEEPGA